MPRAWMIVTKNRLRLFFAAGGMFLFILMWRWIYWGEFSAFISNIPLGLASFSMVGGVVHDVFVARRPGRRALASVFLLAAYSFADISINLRPSNQIACAIVTAGIESSDGELPRLYRLGTWLLVPYLIAVKYSIWGTEWDVYLLGMIVGSAILFLPLLLLTGTLPPGTLPPD